MRPLRGVTAHTMRTAVLEALPIKIITSQWVSSSPVRKESLQSCRGLVGGVHGVREAGRTCPGRLKRGTKPIWERGCAVEESHREQLWQNVFWSLYPAGVSRRVVMFWPVMPKQRLHSYGLIFMQTRKENNPHSTVNLQMQKLPRWS